ncbi:hypothetical protein K492DRAFT_131919, partial [Lichtheimia hyalospora FSU 10163]
RRFSPVILFHDHRFIRDSGDLEHIHIPYRDPHYVTLIESHKKRINQMLQDNATITSYDKPLSPVPSLATSSPSGTGTGGNIKKRQRSNLPKPVTAILKNWLAEHKKHPYPNEDEKCQLVRQTGLARNQISNWFINARRRILRPMLEEGDEDEDEDDHISYDDKWRSSRRGVNLT